MMESYKPPWTRTQTRGPASGYASWGSTLITKLPAAALITNHLFEYEAPKSRGVRGRHCSTAPSLIGEFARTLSMTRLWSAD